MISQLVYFFPWSQFSKFKTKVVLSVETERKQFTKHQYIFFLTMTPNSKILF